MARLLWYLDPLSTQQHCQKWTFWIRLCCQMQALYKPIHLYYWLNQIRNCHTTWARNPDFVACEQQRRRPACASAQADQRLCWLFSVKGCSWSNYMRNFSIPASPCSWEDWIQHDLIVDPKDQLSCDEAQLYRLKMYIMRSTMSMTRKCHMHTLQAHAHIADLPTTPWGKDTEHLQPQYNSITIKIKRPALSSSVRWLEN